MAFIVADFRVDIFVSPPRVELQGFESHRCLGSRHGMSLKIVGFNNISVKPPYFELRVLFRIPARQVFVHDDSGVCGEQPGCF